MNGEENPIYLENLDKWGFLPDLNHPIFHIGQNKSVFSYDILFIDYDEFRGISRDKGYISLIQVSI